MKRKFWTDFWWLLLYLGIGLVLAMVLMMLVSAALGVSTLSLHLMQWLQNIVAFIVPACLWVRCYKKESLTEALHWHWPGWRLMTLTAVLMVVSLPAMNCFCELCESMPMPQWLYDYAMAMKLEQDPALAMLTDVQGVGGWIALVSLMCVMTGLAEEIVFRGALLRCLARPRGMQPNGERCLTTRNVWWIALTVGIIFAAIHFEVFGFWPRTLLGALFVWLVWRTASIWPAVLAHALNNLFAVITLKEAAPQWLEEQCEAVDVIALSLVLTCAVLWLMVKATRRT